MYLMDFLSKTVKKSNLSIFIYLIANTVLIITIVTLFLSATNSYESGMSDAGTIFVGIVLGLVIYVVSIGIALSPIGEFIVRIQTGCKEITRQDQRAYILPLFQEVYHRAKAEDPNLPDDIQLYINGDETPNAFAVGRKTVCLTEGMMHVEPEQIKAIFAHEFGHLSHRDTDLTLVITVGNLIVTILVLIGKIIMDIIHGIGTICGAFRGGSEGFIMIITTGIMRLVFTIMIAGFSKLWTMLGIALCNNSRRENEFEADEFAARLGYGNQICQFLDYYDTCPPAKGIFETLASTHPNKNDRIARLQKFQHQNAQVVYTNPYRVEQPAGAPMDLPARPATKRPTLMLQAAAVPRPARNPQPAQSAQPFAVCSKCGAHIKPNAKFCGQCGTVVTKPEPIKAARFCPNCGTERTNPKANFCTKCGHAFKKQ